MIERFRMIVQMVAAVPSAMFWLGVATVTTAAVYLWLLKAIFVSRILRSGVLRVSALCCVSFLVGMLFSVLINVPLNLSPVVVVLVPIALTSVSLFLCDVMRRLGYMSGRNRDISVGDLVLFEREGITVLRVIIDLKFDEVGTVEEFDTARGRISLREGWRVAGAMVAAGRRGGEGRG